jgi:hypothetical protein
LIYGHDEQFYLVHPERPSPFDPDNRLGGPPDYLPPVAYQEEQTLSMFISLEEQIGRRAGVCFVNIPNLVRALGLQDQRRDLVIGYAVGKEMPRYWLFRSGPHVEEIRHQLGPAHLDSVESLTSIDGAACLLVNLHKVRELSNQRGAGSQEALLCWDAKGYPAARTGWPRREQGVSLPEPLQEKIQQGALLFLEPPSRRVVVNVPGYLQAFPKLAALAKEHSKVLVRHHSPGGPGVIQDFHFKALEDHWPEESQGFDDRVPDSALGWYEPVPESAPAFICIICYVLNVSVLLDMAGEGTSR